MSREFIYTKNTNNHLTNQQRQFYEDNGYIVIKQNVDHNLLDKLRLRFIDICDKKAENAQVMTIMKDASLMKTGAKGQYLINKIQDFLFDSVLFEYASYGPVVDVVESVIGPDVTAVHSMLINKPPDASPNTSLHPLHQDMHYFPFRPAERIVASWTAMEDVDESNGCLHVIPGTHKGEFYEHTYPDGSRNKFYHGVDGFDHLEKVHVRMNKGDTVFFHPILLHGSGPNRTKGFRKAISCHYANSNCYFVDLEHSAQKNIANEVESLLKKRNITLKYADVWKLKSRLVRGEAGNFQNLSSSL